MTEPPHENSLPERTPTGELARLFLRLGFTAFGGPAAHIALMKEEVVTRRKWLTESEFLDLLGAANLVPGPSSTELAIHIGFRRGGGRGLLLAGVCFILPAALIVLALAWAYVRFRGLPAVSGVLYGVKPVVIAVVLQAVWGLLRTAVKNRFLAALGLIALLLALLNAPVLPLLFGAGAIAGTARWWGARQEIGGKPLAGMWLIAAAMGLLPFLLTTYLSLPGDTTHTPPTLAPLFLFFAKVGATLYGSGYVLLAFLREGLVTRWHWMTETQLLDATAVGQVTPGPVFTTATFIGYLLCGPWGALVATLGIFLPSFLFVAISGPLIPRLRASALAGSFLDGVNVAALALMASIEWPLGRAALTDAVTITIALVSAILLLRYKVNSVWLIAAGAVIGVVATLLRGGHSL